ncbi:polyprenyl synthetase family protein [Pelomyxa schiedti]|nr:polyprenyl synthetase family protein [Pelomyxa schiedti]
MCDVVRTLSQIAGLFQPVIVGHFHNILRPGIVSGMCADDAFVSYLYQTLEGFVLCGGKRLRPAACLMAYRAVKYIDKPAPPLEEDVANRSLANIMLAAELLHTSTLVHDDIMDEDSLRRGNPTVWKILRDWEQQHPHQQQHRGILFHNSQDLFAVSHGILAGNILTSEALRLSSTSALPPSCTTPCCPVTFGVTEDVTRATLSLQNELERRFLDAYTVVNLGQVLDMVGCQLPTEQVSTTTESNSVRDLTKWTATYEYMMAYKTAKLFELSVCTGALIAGATPEQLAGLTKYAHAAAIAFQLQDDVLDISDNSQKGREFASDIRQGKATMLVTTALARAPPDEVAILKEVLCSASCNNQGVANEAWEARVHEAARIINKHGLPVVKERIHQLVLEAKASLETISLSTEGIQFLTALADYLVERTY